MKESESTEAPELSRELDEHSVGDEELQRWLAARRWQRRMARALAPLKLTLAQWLVLNTLARLIRESNDAVSQILVGRHLEMDKATLCTLMQKLDRRGLVDRAPEFGGSAYRIYLSPAGRTAARQGRLRVDAIDTRED
ncbi:MAG: MarR family transcriptional regulator [Deltaproteobacteria bacterium]